MGLGSWFRICRPNGAAVLEDLKTKAAAGDIAGFVSSMQKWDATCSNMKWAKINNHDDFYSFEHYEPPNSKALVLHRVLTAAAEAGQVNIVKYLIEQRGCSPHHRSLMTAFMNEQWSVLELFLANGWDINRSTGGNNTYPILAYVEQILSTTNLDTDCDFLVSCSLMKPRSCGV
jgi:hypothetical protein